MSDNSIETIIKAIREEIWANNQMQLAAFYANLLPPLSSPAPTSTKFRNWMPILYSIVALSYLIWCVLMCVALWKRGHQRGKMRVGMRARKPHQKDL
jgi:hypothetical protein